MMGGNTHLTHPACLLAGRPRQRRARTLCLVELDTQLVEWYGHKVVQVDPAEGQLRLAVRWYQRADQIRAHGELCVCRRNHARQHTRF